MAEEQNYTVLARKYRPFDLDGLIGQDALVRTLKNALKSGRLAHAFLLTGIRGVGKTSTARIIARALNNIPKEDAVDSHIDVVEMDAASNTGVDDMREVIEASRYRPLSAPYKIFIIDEVHMLSKNAFNALLKTLEEPPEHVKFIFATTEIRKVPVTILSRCQRFDLRRVDAEVIAKHLHNIALQEKVQIEDGAIRLLSSAAEGSVRDSLSLLDQAISYSGNTISEELVQEMLGYADKSKIILLFEVLLAGKIEDGLRIFEEISQTSAEPQQVIKDMLEFCHLITRFKISPKLKPENITELEAEKAAELAQKLSMSVLTFVWQMLLKAVSELQSAPNPGQAAEMALIRISHSTELPDNPDDLIRPPRRAETQAESQQPPAREFQSDFVPSPTTFAELAGIFKAKRELLVYQNLINDVSLVSIKPEQLEVSLGADAPKDLPGKVASLLSEWTGKRWMVSVSASIGEVTLAEQFAQKKQDLLETAKSQPSIQMVFERFPDAKITDVRESRSANGDNAAKKIMDKTD
ncbi:MAG: DNA polymerase III, subunit gamma and tau [Alphaproteobacteria bacterium CG11_big_fil_rev_8_21_14_0_20_44_7]|nr:MAG: DNA polymerase III, subunit gamma and tau [Alphaproteobacteria bacterium CG11_big_fil_rev_8_21_14_0_20_44_7]